MAASEIPRQQFEAGYLRVRKVDTTGMPKDRGKFQWRDSQESYESGAAQQYPTLHLEGLLVTV